MTEGDVRAWGRRERSTPAGIGEGEGIAGALDPGGEFVLEFLTLFLVTADLGEVDEFVGIVVEVEEHPGLAFEHGVFPTVAGNDAAPRTINAEFESGGTDDLQVGGIGVVGGGFSRKAFGRVIGAREPIGHVESAEAEGGGRKIHVIENVIAWASL